MTQLRLYVFGPPRLERGGQPVELGLRKALALCVYLASSRQPQSRDVLATLLWPDQDQREARASLRRTLHRLTQAIGDAILVTGTDTVDLAPSADLWIDAVIFEQLAADDPAAAVALYSDDFLAGFSLPDSATFDEWQFFERERLRQRLAGLLEDLVAAAQERGDWAAAADYARRWVSLDMLHEPAQRALLAAYASSGQAAAAQRQYQELARVLDVELGSEPEQETRELYEAIRSRRFTAAAPPASPPPGPAPGSSGPAPAPLVGRERELAELLDILGDTSSPRLVTIAGPGGVGKTRLAQAVVDAARPRFAQGAQFVSLVDVAEPAGIAPAIAAQLGMQPGGEIEERLRVALRERAILLALDNCEHLLDGAPTIAAICEAAPRVRILVTSRERLGLSGELVYALGGLGVPDEDTEADTLEAEAARLLVLRARLVRPELALDAAETAAIARICRLVQGMPLALVLAASWAELLSFSAIGEEIARSLSFLHSEQRDVPERQRSIRSVFEGSWGRLPPDAQRAFARLTVFSVGLTRQAFEAVTGAGLATLRRLVSASLLSADPQADRYTIHELLRQIAADTLADDPDLGAARAAHSTYYLGMLARLSGDLKSARQQVAVATLAADFDNLRVAWRQAIARGDRSAIAGAAEGLGIFCELHGALREGEMLFAEAAAFALAGDAGADGLAGQLLAVQGNLAARRKLWGEGRSLLERGVALLRAASQTPAAWLGSALLNLGFVERFQGRFAAAERLAEESLEVFAIAEERWGVAGSLLLMGTALARQGRPALASQLLQACLAQARDCGAHDYGSFAAWNLARLRLIVGDQAQARRLLDEALALANSIGHPISACNALRERGRLALAVGDHAAAEADLEASAARFTAIGMGDEAAHSRAEAGLAHHMCGDSATAARLLDQGLARARRSGDRWYMAHFLGRLGLVTGDRGDSIRAAQLHEEALAIWRGMGHEPNIAGESAGLAFALLGQGADAPPAHELARSALELALRHQLAPAALAALVVAAELLGRSGKPQRARELLAMVGQHPATEQLWRARASRLASSMAAAEPEGQVAADGLPAPAAAWRGVASAVLHELEHGAAPAAGPPPTNLDPRLPALIGREWELADLLGLLAVPARRLVTLLGPGGIGKTRLAMEAGLAGLELFPDGVFFVPLATLSAPEQVAGAIAEELGLRSGGADALQPHLLRFLGSRQLLLILDNIEHLLADLDLLTTILRQAPQTTLLVTSRERLGLEGEVVMPLGGIEVPADETDAQALERGAVRLLLLRARQSRPDLELTPTELDAVIRICRLVDGMPLALILAASWADMLSFAAIAAEIARGIDLLEGDLRDLPARQRSVRAVFESSWGRLSAATRGSFSRLSVFRGGFTREAATQVAGATLHTLRALINSSFITLDREDRYGVHELLRQFGAEQLGGPGEAERLRDRHSAYYLAALAALEPALKGRRQLAAIASIEADLENLRLAWRHGLERRDVQSIGRALDSLFEFNERRGRFREGAELIGQARSRLVPGAEDGPLWSRLTIRLSVLCSRFPREHQVPLPELERAHTIARDNGPPAEEALANLAIGLFYARAENDYAHALGFVERAYALHCALGDRYFQAEDLARIAICCGYLGDTQAFYDRCLAGYRIAEAEGNQIGMALTLTNLTEALLHLGRYAAMLEYSQRLVAAAEPLGGRAIVVTGLVYSALGHLLLGDLSEARRLAMLSYRISSEIDSGLHAGLALGILSLQAGIGGDDGLAVRFAEEGLESPLNLVATVELYWGLAIAMCGMDRWAEAAQALRAALAAAERFATPVPRVWLLPVLAVLLARQGQPAEATAALALGTRHPLSAPGWMAHWRPLAGLRARLERELGDAAFGAAWARGAQLDLAAAFAPLAAG